MLSVAAVAPSANGYFTVFPCRTSKPLASSMNFTKGVTLANTVITKLGVGGATGNVCLYSNVTTNVVDDVCGSLTSAAFAALPSPSGSSTPKPGRGHRRRAARALRPPHGRLDPHHPRRGPGRPRR